MGVLAQLANEGSNDVDVTELLFCAAAILFGAGAVVAAVHRSVEMTILFVGLLCVALGLLL